MIIFKNPSTNQDPRRRISPPIYQFDHAISLREKDLFERERDLRRLIKARVRLVIGGGGTGMEAGK